MILIIETVSEHESDIELSAFDRVSRMRVPRMPRNKRKGQNLALGQDPHWASKKMLRALEILKSETNPVIVCGDSKAAAFGFLLAEQNPEIPVISSIDDARRILSVADELGVAPTTSNLRALLDSSHPGAPTMPREIVDRESRPPLVVSLVQNSIIGDSRVQKVARSIADLGYQSVLLGLAGEDDPKGDYFFIGNAIVMRCAVGRHRHRQLLSNPPRSASYPLSPRKPQRLRRSAESLRRQAANGKTPLVKAKKKIISWRQAQFKKNKLSFTSIEKRSKGHRLSSAFKASGIYMGDIENHYPLILDIEDAFAPLILSLRPDVIHVHDPILLGVAFRAKAQLEKLGCQVRIVYDAHEWTRGIEHRHANLKPVSVQLERRYISKCDAVITVSSAISELLEEKFALDERPAVIENAPSLEWAATTSSDVRTTFGLNTEVPIVVYVGGLAGNRRADDAVRALVYLHDVHLVLVSTKSGALNQAFQLGRDLDVANRMHRLDYVRPEEVTSFISSASVAIIPFGGNDNADLGGPTKFREYLMAGLPIVAGDTGLTGKRISETGVGLVYPAGRPKKLAAAIGNVLDHLDEYRAAISADLIKQNSWESQLPVFQSLYARLVGPSRGSSLVARDVLIGGTNSAGQATAWARALERQGLTSSSIKIRSEGNKFDFPVDVLIPRDGLNSTQRRVQVTNTYLFGNKAFLLESLQPIASPAPTRMSSSVAAAFREAKALSDSGRQVGLVFHGSDIRIPSHHAADHRWSPFHDKESPLTVALEKRTREVQRHLALWNGPVLVTTLDLIRYCPYAHWLPVVVDCERFNATNRRWKNRKPVVLHMPSNSVLKGTHLIDPILRQLDDENLINYRRPSFVRPSDVAKLMNECDIFVDQLGMGILGVAALEALATGMVVVTDPGIEASSGYEEPLPLVEVDPGNFEERMRHLVGGLEALPEIADGARDFVLRNHDGRKSAEVICKSLKL